MNIRDISELLNHADRDSAAGIRIAKAAGEGSSAVFIAEIDPHTKLRAHHHISGDEVYVILDGYGVMHTQESHLAHDKRTASPVISTPVAADDVFTITPCVIHSLENTSDGPLRAMFICPESHISDDRFFEEDLS